MTFVTYGGVSVLLIAYHGIGIAKCDPSPTASWRMQAAAPAEVTSPAAS